MNNDRLQQGLLAWFKLDPTSLKSLSSIEAVCLNLFRQSQSEPPTDTLLKRKAKTTIFYPLFRMGIIEFYGNNKYGLSPSAILESNGKLLFCHIPEAGTLVSNKQPPFYAKLNIEIYPAFSRSAEQFTKLKHITHPFSLSDIFQLMLPLDRVVDHWEDSVTFDLSDCLFLNERLNWEKAPDDRKNGIYKKGEKVYAQRILKVTDANWKYIPSRAKNPDAFNVAIISSQTKESLNIRYYNQKGILQTGNTPFPLIIERLLIINSLLSDSTLYNLEKREYFISQKDIQKLDKIIGNKIIFYE